MSKPEAPRRPRRGKEGRIASLNSRISRLSSELETLGFLRDRLEKELDAGRPGNGAKNKEGSSS